MRFTILYILLFYSYTFFAQVNLPQVEKQDIEKCEIQKIEFENGFTKIWFRYNNGTSSWACINENTYLEEIPSGAKIPLNSVEGISFCPEKTIFKEANQELLYALSFKGVPLGDKINIIEDPYSKAFNFYGVSINNKSKQPTSFDYELSNSHFGAIKLLSTVLLGILLCYLLKTRFKWWVVFFVYIFISFLFNLFLKFLYASVNHEFVSINFTWWPFVLEFTENLGYCGILALIIFPFFFRKKKKKIEVLANDPSKSEEDLKQEFEKKLQEIRNQAENKEPKQAVRPVSFYLSLLFFIIILCAVCFIYLFSRQIDSDKLEIKSLIDQKDKLDSELKACQQEIKEVPYLTNEYFASLCTITEEIYVHNKLEIPIRIFISLPVITNADEPIQWEEFNDQYYLLEPAYNGTLQNDKTNSTLKSNVIRYFLTDKKGNAIAGSKEHPIYYSPCTNKGRGIILY